MGSPVANAAREHGGWHREIFLKKGLSPETSQRVHAHEIGHAINDLAGTAESFKKTRKSGRQIPFYDIPVSKGMERELTVIYRDMNGGKLPQDFGYKGDDARSELTAEAVRAYMTNPNYIRTVGPETAKAVRKFVRENDELRDIIRFNSLAGAAGAGMYGISGDRQGSPSDANEL